jgi:methylated-DNA-[protein]-cysteine S-methyltransferase
MNAERAVVVETLLGPLGLVVGAQGLKRVFLPDATDRERARASVLGALAELQLAPAAADGVAASWGARMAAHLRGERVVYDDLPLDQSALTPFTRAVYDETRRIPPGETRTYTALRDALGRGSARAIGVAMARNPTPIVVPCHRVIAVGGAGGFSAPGGLATKAALLSLEGGSLDDVEHAMARRHLARVDPALAPLVRARACDLPVRSRGGLFRTLVRAITGQQLSGKAAATIFGRLEVRLGASSPSGTPSWSSDDLTRWRDAAGRLLALSDEALREIGLSSAKSRAVRGLAQAVHDGTVDLASLERAPDAHVVEELVKLRGIGRWTVEMLLMFELGRPDVLPVDDLGIRKGAQRVYRLRELPGNDQLNELAEKWRPFRSIGSWYLWRSLEAAAD